MKLKFSVDKKNSGRAFKVIIDSAPTSRMTRGVVVDVLGEVYLVERDNDSRMRVDIHRKKLPEFCLPIQVGDVVEYELAQAQGPPSAR